MSSRLYGTAGWLAAGAALAAAACSGGPRPPAEPPSQTVSASEPSDAAAPPPPPVAPEPPRPTVSELRPPAPQVVIEPAEPEPDSEPTLAEAALRERERRLRSGQPTVVINDDNLQDHAVGQLTFIEDETPAADTEGADGAPAEEEGPDEQFWRDRVREIRQRWSDAAAQVPELEERVAELRRRFYETDDAYYRDTRIKPAWDRAIDLIAQTRDEAEAHRSELEAALEEGRLAGALPGWLREGIELEPVAAEPESDTHEPGEPKIIEPTEADG